jgi:hypothetical protein
VAEKESLFTSPLQVTASGDVIVVDRGYADYGVRAFLLHHRRDFVLFKTNPTLYRPGRRFPATGGLAFAGLGFIVTWSVWSLNLMALVRLQVASAVDAG